MSFLFPLVIFESIALAKVAPTFQGELLSGGRTKLEYHLKSNRLLLISFWASWCSPCLEELKLVTDSLKKSPSLPVDLLTVNVDKTETSSDVRPTMWLLKFSFPVILDPGHEIFSRYQQGDSLPFSVLLDSRGNILRSFSGYQEELVPAIKKALQSQPNGKASN